ncbi:hypothetical protein O0I10_010026 [Lichtheimia ornata]|uniref:Uncharacterized protein n=1 Tax=Lichtheimia ornata TaxID=688661 RepID=A0AAD7UXM0_9FUNG|nr:uncharacterized protein O0I10_010026 [Lichtheimia ornata]KAJ8654330.1 hypothetical protein O0I10_010026 [Lichtheimia ornata]
MNKDHLSYRITLTNMKVPVSPNFTMKRGVFIRAMCSAWPSVPWVQVSRSSLPISDFAMSPPAKLIQGNGLGLANSTLCESFTFNVATSPKIFFGRRRRRGRPLDPVWLVATLRNLGSASLIVELAPKVQLAKPSTLL